MIQKTQENYFALYEMPQNGLFWKHFMYNGRSFDTSLLRSCCPEHFGTNHFLSLLVFLGCAKKLKFHVSKRFCCYIPYCITWKNTETSVTMPLIICKDSLQWFWSKKYIPGFCPTLYNMDWNQNQLKVKN